MTGGAGNPNTFAPVKVSAQGRSVPEPLIREKEKPDRRAASLRNTPKHLQQQMIPITVQAKRNIATKEVKYYPQIAALTPLTLTDIAERIEQRSTVSSADVKAALDALQLAVREAVIEGMSVRLGDLGSFRPTLRVKYTCEDASKVTADNIGGVRVVFTPGSALRGMLSKGKLSFKIVSNN